MTVSELIQKLTEYPPEAFVVLSKDAEGNRFSPLDDFSMGFYEPESTWSGEYWEPDEDDEAGQGENAATRDRDTLCLWPVN